MTKLLDLDAILPPVKSVKFGGKEFPIVNMTVGLFVRIKQMEGQDLATKSPAEQVVMYAEMVKQLLPSIDDEILGRMTVEQLQQIFNFAMAQVEEENEAAAGEEAK
ncbi:hypothetical protein Ppb6_00669 [Photorhabdus australis subsp. thailandensis]|uniref:Uncharacterized protein n=1 Tax=Photorhabdus australis subsp. thailandensis TaxID=2805096 RepID=A0A1C0U884_9GAMM|nr:hypothetical protein [Photorhabdus australis]OCQ54119.1 hypothetical protein Ppb6_00669 [Photorhabdus australis subsp. thailandensis]